MEARETTFGTLLNGRVQYRVPLFQRQYAWQTKQREQLWSDVLELYDERRGGVPGAQHFMGSLVTAPEQLGPNRPATHTLIDGQQRLTTLSVMLVALRDVMSGEDEDEASRIDGLYLKNQFPQEPSDEFKVLPTQRDRDEFAALVQGTGDTGGSPGLRQTYRYFRERLVREEDGDGNPLHLSELEHTLLQGLGVVSITLESNDNPYRVFESLNSTGLELRQIDLIRNLFMMKMGIEQAEHAYTEIWLPMEEKLGQHFEAFAHDYYLKDGVFMRADDTYANARSRLEDAEGQQVVTALEDMAWFAERWIGILRPNREEHEGLADALTSLNRFGTETPYPFLLNLYEARDRAGTVTSEELADVVSMIEGFLIRRMFANVATNQLNRLFIRLWDQLPKEAEIRVEVRLALSEPSRRWSSDGQFREDFVRYPLYIDSQPRQLRLVLDRLEESYGHRETVELDELQVEHVVPQTLTDSWRECLGAGADELHDQWLHTIGNLTLTGYNPELSNAPWPDKRVYYGASNVSMTRELAERDLFDIEALTSRAHELAERAVEIWPGPTSDQA